MSAPTQPTAALIVAEAYNQVGLSSPTAAQLTRATDYGLEKVKRDIWAMGKRWRTLRASQFLGLIVGVSRYANPTDFEQDLQEPSLTLLDGTSRGTLQSAAAGTATLAAAESIATLSARGKLLVITSGTQQAEQIQTYSSTTKVATMRASWGTTPAGTEAYLVAETELPIALLAWQRRAFISRQGDLGQPQQAFSMGSGPLGYIELDRVPDKVYGLRRDYFSNLLLLDLTSTLYSQILRNWAGIFTQGVIDWIESGYDDTRRPIETSIYGQMLKKLAGQEMDLMNDSNLQQRLVD